MRRCLLALGAAVGLILGLMLLGPPATSGAWTHCDAVSPSTTEADCPTTTAKPPPESVPESSHPTTVPKPTSSVPASSSTTVAKPTTTPKPTTTVPASTTTKAPPETVPAPTTSILPGQNGHGGCVPGWHVPGVEGSGTPCLPDTPTTTVPPSTAVPVTTPITVEKPVPPIATTIAQPAPSSTVALVAAPAPSSTSTTLAAPVETVDALAHTGWGGNILILAGVAGVLAGAALLYSRRFGQTPPVG